MTTTLNRSYRYPSTGQVPDVNGDIQKLAEDLDADMTAQVARIVATEKASKGIQAIAEMTANGVSSAGYQVVQYIPTFTFKAGRWYEVEWTCGFVYTSGGGNVLAQIHTCAVTDLPAATTGLTELMGWNVVFSSANQTVRGNPKRKIKYGADTTVQVKGTINGNGAVIQPLAGPTFPAQLSIRDLGANL